MGTKTTKTGSATLLPSARSLPIHAHVEKRSGGERGIRTLDTGFPVYSLSRRAPSTYSAISPCVWQPSERRDVIPTTRQKINQDQRTAPLRDNQVPGIYITGPGHPHFTLQPHHFPFFRSMSINLATALSVSKTPSPDVAHASNSGTFAGFSSRRNSSTGMAPGTSRLLY